MTAPRTALFALMVLAGAAQAAPPPGGAAPHHGTYPGSGHGQWYGPSVRFYYGGPYWGWGWGRGWPGFYWPGHYAPGVYYGPGYGYGYAPPYYVYGPPGWVTSTAGVVYIQREAGTVSTQQPEPAPAPPPASDAAVGVPPPAGIQWWYLCNSPRGAYPYVRECPGGWERVPAVPPDRAK